jgi:hypothetical protein
MLQGCECINKWPNLSHGGFGLTIRSCPITRFGGTRRTSGQMIDVVSRSMA